MLLVEMAQGALVPVGLAEVGRGQRLPPLRRVGRAVCGRLDGKGDDSGTNSRGRRSHDPALHTPAIRSGRSLTVKTSSSPSSTSLCSVDEDVVDPGEHSK